MPFSPRTLLVAAGLVAAACQTNTNPTSVQPLEAPASISSISLDSAIFLDWADNAYENDPSRFSNYQVYSASYNLDQGVCGSDWVIEGTTVAHEFLAAQLRNGVPRCFYTTAFSIEGLQSDRSPLWQDTPRPDARNVLVWALGVNTPQSGFRFWSDDNANNYGDPGELGLVQDGTGTDIDLVVHLNAADSTLWIVPVFAGTSVQLYSPNPVADLTSIDFAPASGYARDSLLARPGFGYVFEIVDGSVLHYGALRMTHVGRQYAIFDWSVQTDSGNAELVSPRPPALTGNLVAGSK